MMEEKVLKRRKALFAALGRGKGYGGALGRGGLGITFVRVAAAAKKA